MESQHIMDASKKKRRKFQLQRAKEKYRQSAKGKKTTQTYEESDAGKLRKKRYREKQKEKRKTEKENEKKKEKEKQEEKEKEMMMVYRYGWLNVGAKVRIYGLHKTQKLNGCEGRITETHEYANGGPSSYTLQLSTQNVHIKRKNIQKYETDADKAKYQRLIQLVQSKDESPSPSPDSKKFFELFTDQKTVN